MAASPAASSRTACRPALKSTTSLSPPGRPARVSPSTRMEPMCSCRRPTIRAKCGSPTPSPTAPARPARPTITSTISPVSDGPSAPSSNGVEDTPAAIGALLADPARGIRESDRDGSEIITGVTIGAASRLHAHTARCDTRRDHPRWLGWVDHDYLLAHRRCWRSGHPRGARQGDPCSPRRLLRDASLDVSIITKDGDAAPARPRCRMW